MTTITDKKNVKNVVRVGKHLNVFPHHRLDGVWRAVFRHKGDTQELVLPVEFLRMSADNGTQVKLAALTNQDFYNAWRACYDRVAEGKSPKPEVASVAWAAGTLGFVINRFMKDEISYLRHAQNTRDDYRRSMEELLAYQTRKGPLAGYMMKHIDPECIATVQGVIAKQKIKLKNGGEKGRKSRADHMVMMVGMLWNFAVKVMFMKDIAQIPNPAVGLRMVHLDKTSNEAWPLEIVLEYLDGASLRERLCLMLCLYTGQRVSDVAQMKWTSLWTDEDGARWVKVKAQVKTDEPVDIPVAPQLQAVLDEVTERHEHGFIVVNQYGAADRDGSGISISIKKRIKAIANGRADVVKLTTHGLRANAIHCLVRAGCPDPLITSITGHRDPKSLETYKKGVIKLDNAKAAMDAWQKASPRLWKRAETIYAAKLKAQGEAQLAA